MAATQIRVTVYLSNRNKNYERDFQLKKQQENNKYLKSIRDIIRGHKQLCEFLINYTAGASV